MHNYKFIFESTKQLEKNFFNYLKKADI